MDLEKLTMRATFVIEELARPLGELTIGLLGTEMLMRLFLNNCKAVDGKAARWAPLSIRKGQSVPLTPVTSYDSMGKLIKKANKALDTLGVADRIDASIVEARDLVAHGRPFATANGPWRLIKLARKSKDGQVDAEGVARLTEGWFKEQRRRIEAIEDTIQRVARERGIALVLF